MTQENLGNAVFTLDVNDAAFNRGLSRAEQTSAQTGRSFGRAAAGIGRAAAGLSIAAIGLAAPFQATSDAIRQSIATGTGAAGEDLDRLTDQVRDVAGQWGTSWEAAGEIVAAVANIPTVSEAQELALLDLTASFQRAGGSANELALTVNVATDNMGASIGEAADVVAFLAQTAQATGVGADFMAAAFRRASGDAQILGLSASDTAALIAGAAEVGGNALVRNLAPAFQQLIDRQRIMDVTTEEFNDSVNSLFEAIVEGSEGAIREFSDELGITDTVTNDLRQAIGGMTAEQQANLLVTGELTSALGGASNALTTQNAETLTATERWQGIRNVVSGFIQEQLTDLPTWAQTGLAAANDVIGVMGQASTAILLVAQNTTIMSAATRIFATIARLTGIVLRIVTTTALGPIGIAIAALAAIALVVVANWTTFRDIFIAIWDVVKSAVADAIDFVIGLINQAIRNINRLISGINTVSRTVGGPQIGLLSELTFDANFTGGRSTADTFAALTNRVQGVNIGDLLRNTQSQVSGFFGGGNGTGDVNVNIQGDILESEETNDRIVREIERAVVRGKLTNAAVVPQI